MKIKCIKMPKSSKNVTVGKEYEVDTISSNFTEKDLIEVLNDIGVKRRYRAHLFEPVNDHESNYLNWRRENPVTVNFDRRDFRIRISSSIENNFNFNFYNAEISCGITYMSGIEPLVGFLDTRLYQYLDTENSNTEFTNRLIDDDLNAINLHYILKENISGAFVLASTFVPNSFTDSLEAEDVDDTDNDELYDFVKSKVIRYFDAIAEEEESAIYRSRVSKSSRNSISIWTINVTHDD